MDDKATIFSIVLGVAMMLASLGLAVTGFHYTNGLFVPLVLGVGGIVLFWWPCITASTLLTVPPVCGTRGRRADGGGGWATERGCRGDVGRGARHARPADGGRA